MKLTSMLRGIARKLKPPGNRGSLDTNYRQGNLNSRDVPVAPIPRDK
jgi:hypothetical protein